jgi:hypothetical protein
LACRARRAWRRRTSAELGVGRGIRRGGAGNAERGEESGADTTREKRIRRPGAESPRGRLRDGGGGSTVSEPDTGAR